MDTELTNSIFICPLVRVQSSQERILQVTYNEIQTAIENHNLPYIIENGGQNDTGFITYISPNNNNQYSVSVHMNSGYDTGFFADTPDEYLHGYEPD